VLWHPGSRHDNEGRRPNPHRAQVPFAPGWAIQSALAWDVGFGDLNIGKVISASVINRSKLLGHSPSARSYP